MRTNASTLSVTAALASAVLLLGCHTTQRRSDASLQNNRDFPLVSYDRFYTKRVSLARPATHVLQVRQLPFPIYPCALTVGITPQEAASQQNSPWQGARLRVDFRDLSGTVFFSTNLSLAMAQRGKGNADHHQIDLQFRPGDPLQSPPAGWTHTDYDVVVTVLTPSMNPNHQVELWALTKL